MRYSLLVVVGMLFTITFSHAADIQTGITYASHGDREMKLDFISPGGKMRPLLICIHGGGWRAGNKRSLHSVMQTAAENGVAAASIEYRLSDEAVWPAQFEDVRAAHQFLIDHADEYGIDPERIGITGGSAGGHLSLMLGLAPSETSEGHRTRTIINLYGPTELRHIEKLEHVRAILEQLVGGKLEEHRDELADASPLRLVDRTDPPVVTFHGMDDDIVPFEQATMLHEALTTAQVTNKLHAMKDTGHGLDGHEDLFKRVMVRQMEMYLKGPSNMPLVAYEDFDAGTSRWKPTDDMAWKANSKDGRSYYSLIKKVSDYKPKVRSPHNIALLNDVEVGDFVLDVDMRSTNEPYGHQSLCLFFGHQNPSHFYYVHFGRKADAHANSIFLVDDEPRVSIATERTDGTDWSRGWHRARIRRDVKSGLIEVYLDDMQTPVMRAEDKTFTHGKIGIGSFDDMGDFDSIRLWGKEVEKN